MNWRRDPYVISDKPSLLNINYIHAFLADQSYWAKGRKRETVEKSVANSLNFGVYDQDMKQIGFARVITDQATFSWILDVFIEEDYRGEGLGQWLLECLLEHPSVKGTNLALATKDAHDFYEKFGFERKECMRLNRRKE
ncbi:MAG: GNAT family N-acetyltransferase [Bacillus sp. (in: Bacteria)]|nr:GNAT family N-acetyltransferase [Bacillus sp. (in: firmicutes)]